MVQGLKDAGIKVWLDEAELKIGDSIVQSLEAGIEGSDFLIALLSQNSVKSKWVAEEIRLALNLQITNATIKILPVVIGNCDIPGFLKDKLYLDLRQDFDLGLQKLARQILAT